MDLCRSGSYVAVTQSPKPIRKHWGPSRRHASHDASSTPAPATRDGVTARPIQPRRRASLSTVAQRAGRPMARPVSVHAQTVDGRPMQYRTLCKEIPRPCWDAEPATPPRGAHVPSTNRSTPMRRNLASVGVGAGPTPSVRKPRRGRRGGCHTDPHCPSPITSPASALPNTTSFTRSSASESSITSPSASTSLMPSPWP